jgi:hypothetical protein
MVAEIAVQTVAVATASLPTRSGGAQRDKTSIPQAVGRP